MVVQRHGDFLKSQLQQHFGDELSFRRPNKRNTAQLMFRSNVPPGPLIERCSQLLAAGEEAAQDGDNLSLDDMPEIDVESNLPRSAALQCILCSIPP